jgi:hypothetical protein
LDLPTTHSTTHPHDAAHHEELGFWRKYVFSLDHKVIGLQYAITGLLFLLFGFTLMMIMRFQLAYPGRPIPLIGNWFGVDKAPGGIMLPSSITSLARCTADHGFPRCRASGVGLRQLRRAAADWRARWHSPSST